MGRPAIQVVVLGGGHAGLAAARELMRARRRHPELQMSVVSRDTAMLWHGLMPQVISNLIPAQDALISLRRVLPGATIYPYEVHSIDFDAKHVIVARGSERDDLVLPYDYLVIALGSATNLSSFPGLAEHGLQAMSFGDAFHLRNHVLDMLELAEIETDTEERARMLTFVVAGGGFGGVEIASEINGLLRDSLRYYPAVAASEIRVVLVSSSPRILRALDEKLGRRALERVKGWGVQVRLNTGIQSATVTSVELDNGERISTRTLVVSTGTAPPPLLIASGLPMVHGRLDCDKHGRVATVSGVYAAGDNAAIVDAGTGHISPATVASAHAQGRMVACNITAELEGKPLSQSRASRFQVASLTRTYGLLQYGRFQLDGLLAALIWRAHFVRSIPSWYRRTTLLLDWLLTSTFPRDVTQLRIARTNAMLPMRFGAGEVIIRQGEPGSRFYVITEGQAEVVQHGRDGSDREVAVLGPGRYFGEIALLRGSGRTATVRAITDLAVVSLDRRDFGMLVRVLPHILDTVGEQSPREPVPVRVDTPGPSTELRALTAEELEQLGQRKGSV
jgi:NADH dehydrogenase